MIRLNIEKELLKNEIKILEAGDYDFNLKYALNIERLEILRLKELLAILRKIVKLEKLKTKLEKMI